MGGSRRPSHLIGGMRLHQMISNREIVGRTTTEEDAMKTMAIRLDDEVHAQLVVIAQLRDSTITEEIRVAIEAHLNAARADQSLAAQADEVLAEIDAEALKRRDAISTLFTTPPAKPARRTRKSTTEDP